MWRDASRRRRSRQAIRAKPFLRDLSSWFGIMERPSAGGFVSRLSCSQKGVTNARNCHTHRRDCEVVQLQKNFCVLIAPIIRTTPRIISSAGRKGTLTPRRTSGAKMTVRIVPRPIVRGLTFEC